MVTVMVGSASHPVSDRLYGAFLEDINMSVDGGLNANVVNNYSFDGVYLKHHSMRVRGTDRWRTQADPLRFWQFHGVSATSYGTQTRGEHGQRIETSCPAPPLHPNSRYVRVTLPAGRRGADIENLGYNGGGKHAGDCAIAIAQGHRYDFGVYARPVAGVMTLAVSVVNASGVALTDCVTLSCSAPGNDLSSAAAAGSCDPDDADCINGWVHLTCTLSGLASGLGKLHIGLIAGEDRAGDCASAGDGGNPGEGNAGDTRGYRAHGYSAGLSGMVPDTADGRSGCTPRPAPAVRSGAAQTDAQAISSTTGSGDIAIPVSDTVIDLDCVVLMDSDTWGAGDPKWRYGRFRRDLVEAIAALKPAFLRFPGGCITEGVTPGNEYRWKDTVGALYARRQQYNMWAFRMPDGSSYSQSYQIGFYEYFCLCEDLGAKPLPTLFAGMTCQSPYRDPQSIPVDSEYFRDVVVQDYLDLIEFANGDPDASQWARVRRDMGHPAPFGLDMIGIGNENYGQGYMERFDAIAKAIHERYPSILCVMSAGLFPYRLSMRRAWNHARDIAAGRGEMLLACDPPLAGSRIIVDEHSYHTPEWFASQARRYDGYPRDSVGVMVGEYSANGYLAGRKQDNAHANTWASALGEAAFLTGCERNSDVVRMTSYAPLLARVPGKGWMQNLIEFDARTVMPTLNAEVEQLFAKHIGPMAYQCELGDAGHTRAGKAVGSRLFVSATGDESTRFIKLVNTGGDRIDVTLDISFGLRSLGARPRRDSCRLHVVRLCAAPEARNVLGDEGVSHRVAERREDTFAMAGPPVRFALGLPAYSVTMVTVTL
ncbi:alpha-L-arabinofuranosidase C-terminal domain-containing protein [Bifidobacterium sp.]|uniref:alpha-L-arabinofuranosidase C-terminal domain-containing protein n=1 Tax=Bifidobacterium sp. TaxID=41200 RepID=UPI002A90F462|nr:alpha-L-arabinofuranosidase C-terminal domain-containing protein [Bifidobacterium sp.]MDY5368686.1 alpha-L-arabinofuranosidase C-terminal domain-containing protein [Bifidobacterium sp.]